MNANDEFVTIPLEGDLTIARSDVVRLQIAKALENNGNIELDCQSASSIDVSFVQLVLAARISARSHGICFRIKQGRNDALMTVLRSAGFIGADGISEDALWG